MSKNREKFEYKLSAVVLVYNGERFLRPCLDSLVNQTLDDLEIILINDVSTDDSLSICKEYAKDHSNIRIINKEINEGLAVNANLGIKEAKGEYVILVDHDDIIPNYAYEKLYTKAKETDADICIGQANLLHGPYQSEIADYERNVWREERTIHSVLEYPEIFHDAFYWNKIMRRSFLIENNITLPKDMIYADRKFSHTAYIHAKTISIIPDCVYIWRIVKNDASHESLSIKRREADNYINRIDSYEIDLDKITSTYEDYFKILMRRVIVPISGIIESNNFKEAYYNRGVKLLKEECFKIKDLYNNDLKNLDNIFIYLSLNDKKEEIEKLLRTNLALQRDIINENNKSYWKLDLMQDKTIPKELFEIKTMTQEFLNIGKIITNDNSIIFKEINIPKYLKTTKLGIQFVGRTRYGEVLKENTLLFELEQDKETELYKVEIKKDQLKSFEMYDIFFYCEFEDNTSNKFRIKKECIEDIDEQTELFRYHITPSNNLSMASQHFEDNWKIQLDEDKIRFINNKSNNIKKNLKIVIKDLKTNEETYLSLTDDEKEYFLEWEFFLDPKSLYKIQLRVYGDEGKLKRNIKLKLSDLTEFKSKQHKINSGIQLKIYEKNNEIFIKTK